MIISSVLLIIITLATFVYCLQCLQALTAKEAPWGWMFAATFCLLVGALAVTRLPLSLPASVGWFTTSFIAFLMLLGSGFLLNLAYNANKKRRYPY